MKTKQEQFNEMILNSCDIKENPNCEECLFSTVCDVKEICEKLYKAGYRKASDVIEDFVKKLIDFPHWLENGTVLVIHMEELLELAAEMRQEVEK